MPERVGFMLTGPDAKFAAFLLRKEYFKLQDTGVTQEAPMSGFPERWIMRPMIHSVDHTNAVLLDIQQWIKHFDVTVAKY